MAGLASFDPAQDRPNDGQTIATIGARLQGIGVPAVCFQEATYLRQGYTSTMFAGLLGIFKDVEDVNRLERILQLEIQLQHFNSIHQITPAEFYAFLEFLQSSPGKKAIYKMNLHDRLKRRGGNAFTAEDVGSLSIFEAQTSEFVHDKNYIRIKYDMKIEQLESKIHAERAKMKKTLDGLTTKFAPASGYLELESASLNRACWAEHLSDCRRKGGLPPQISHANMNKACQTYNEVVRQRHMLDYLAGEGRKAQLENFANVAIGRLEADQDVPAAKRFRGLLAAVGAEAAPPASMAGARKVVVAAGPVHLETTGKSSRRLSSLLPEEMMRSERQARRKSKAASSSRRPVGGERF